MNTFLCIILMLAGFGLLVAGILSIAREDFITRAKVRAMSRTANMPSYVGSTVIPSNYATKHMPLVEFDINGYFNKEGK